MKRTIHINCDVGEGLHNENALFPYISYASVACGGHAGDAHTIRVVAGLAKKYGVKIGAHPSYPDKKNFGRVSMDIRPVDLKKSIAGQIRVLMSVTDGENVPLHHIKAHGALYNDIAKDKTLASLYLDALQPFGSDFFLLVPSQSEIEKMALQRKFKVLREAFGDRNYAKDLTLIPRTHPNAVISHPEAVAKHMATMVLEHKVTVGKEEKRPIQADTICIHGDNANALKILMYLSDNLSQYGIEIVK